MKRVRYFLEALVVLPLLYLIRCLPLAVSSRFGGRLARLLGQFRKETAMADRSLQLVLPDLSADERETVISQVWDNLGRTGFEFINGRKLETAFDDRVEIVGQSILDEIKSSGRPVIFVSGHFANWNVALLAVNRCFGPTGAVFRAVNNPYVDGPVREAYAKFSPVPIAKNDPISTWMSVLKSLGSLSMLADQHLTTGVEVEFLGQKVMAPPGPATLALRAKAAVMPVVCERLIDKGDGVYFRVTFLPEILADESLSRQRDKVIDLTQKYYNFLAEQIRHAPRNWLWLHDRFFKVERSAPVTLDGDA